MLDKLKEVLSPIGDSVSSVFSEIIAWISQIGLNLSNLQIKIVSLIILLVGFFVTIKFLSKINKVVGFVILILILIFIAAIILSL